MRTPEKIVVTGGLGFIGSHLCELLRDRHPEADLFIIDDLSSSSMTPDVAGRFVKRLKASWFYGAVQDAFSEQNAGAMDNADAYFHLASPVGPAGVLDHSGYIASSIVDDTMVVADAAHYYGGRMVFVSTSEVYGGGRDGLCSEDMPCIVPAEPSARLEYAVGKLAAEVALRNLVAVHNVDAVIVRPFNVAGPRQASKGGFVLPRFIQQAAEGGELTVFAPNAVRAFTHVIDMADGIFAAYEYGEKGHVYNIGNPLNRVTIEKLAELVVKIVGKGSLKLTDPREVYGTYYAEASDKFPDITKAKDTLGWSPEFSLEDVVQSAYTYYLQQQEARL